MTLKAPSADRQVAFHLLLVAARNTVLMDALREALGSVDPDEVNRELADLAPADARAILAGAGIRDEHVFPTPTVLTAKPSLVGYYRLLLGAPQKTFYGTATGMGMFKRMESHGTLSDKHRAKLVEFCQAMATPLADLVRQLSPTVTPRDVQELPLLVLGSQFQGGANNIIGQKATEAVFIAIKEIVADYIESDDGRVVTVRNASDRRVRLALAADPDVRITEEFGEGEFRPKVAIEIKGGTDRSNAYNRAGEAEKSHNSAHEAGFRDFWTVITKTGLSMSKLEEKSPKTRSWFDAAQVLAREGDDWEEFRSRIAEVVGIPVR